MLRSLRECLVPLPTHLCDAPSGQVAPSDGGAAGGAGGGGIRRVVEVHEVSPPEASGDKWMAWPSGKSVEYVRLEGSLCPLKASAERVS